MSRAVYGRLAVTNIKNNRKTYIPYIFTSVLIVMMYFIMIGLSENNSIDDISLLLILRYASVVISIFSVIFLFYTNSFLIKRRKKEIGVYNILGMGKGHIAKMLAIETAIITSISIVSGLLLGILFSRLMWLLLIKLIGYDTGMEYMISSAAVLRTVVLFGAVFTVTLLYNLMQIRLSNPVEILHGSSQGEREPKTKLLLTLFGVVMLGIGYYIAITTEDPLSAIPNFFIGVVTVILGTYALFIAGSIALLKMLRKNKRFYYKSSHFVSVSGMIYRMKQNAAGLASICILSTIVLVLVSTSVCMYFGAEDMLLIRYPSEISVTNYMTTAETEKQISDIVQEAAKENNVEVTEEKKMHFGVGSIFKDGNQFSLEADGDYSISDISDFIMIPQEDYNKMSGDRTALKADEIIFYSTKEKMYGWDNLVLSGKTYHIVKELKSIWREEKNDGRFIEGFYIIFPDSQAVEEILRQIYDNSNMRSDWAERMCQMRYELGFSLKGEESDRIRAEEAIRSRVEGELPDVSYESREQGKSIYYSMYGCLFFIGIYLGTMFLMATVLIIYYKQISEGYDDRERYQIMKKVGMSKKEVKRSIKSQVLLVFFLPLAVAILHVSAAFTVVKKLLAIIYLVNVPLFLSCTVATIAVFAVFYVLVYSITAREYYRIVE